MRTNFPPLVVLSVSLLLGAHLFALWKMVEFSGELPIPLWIPYITLAVVYSFLAGILLMILRGKSWARTTYAVLAFVSLLSITGQTLHHALATWLLIAVKLVALVLLVTPSSNAWFAAGGPNQSFKPTSLRDAA